jgi:hypothetical protein
MGPLDWQTMDGAETRTTRLRRLLPETACRGFGREVADQDAVEDPLSGQIHLHHARRAPELAAEAVGVTLCRRAITVRGELDEVTEAPRRQGRARGRG